MYRILTILPFPTPNLILDRLSLHILVFYNPCPQPVPPVLLGKLLHGDGLVGRGLLLHLVLVVLPAHDLQVDPVLPADVLLLLEEDGGVSDDILQLHKLRDLLKVHNPDDKPDPK